MTAESAESSTLLSVSDLICTVGSMQILNSVTLSVRAGECVGLIGPNGSGKTTLFNCLSGFLPARSGTIRLREKNLTYLPAYERARLGLGRVFQNSGVFREMTVMENLLTSLESKSSLGSLLFPSRRTASAKKSAMEYLAQVGLVTKVNAKAGSLSGGQLRLLEIVRALAFGAELLLLDEPTAGVSPKMKGDLRELIQSVVKSGKTVLIIEHDMAFIDQLCSRVAVLDQGRVVLEGRPEVVRSDPRLQEIYFGTGSEKSA